MPHYCEQADVEAYDVRPSIVYDGSTRPTATQIAARIELVALEMDARLANIYVVPITGTNSLKIVADINAIGVAWWAAQPVVDNLGATDRKHVDRLKKWFDEKMEALLTPVLSKRINLADATKKTGMAPYCVSETPKEIAFPDKDLDDFIKGSKI